MVTINDRDRLEWHDGMTVQDALDRMGYDFVMMTVAVNGVLVPEEDYGSHLLPDEARVTVFHLMHGG